MFKNVFVLNLFKDGMACSTGFWIIFLISYHAVHETKFDLGCQAPEPFLHRCAAGLPNLLFARLTSDWQIIIQCPFYAGS